MLFISLPNSLPSPQLPAKAVTAPFSPLKGEDVRRWRKLRSNLAKRELLGGKTDYIYVPRNNMAYCEIRNK